MRSTHASAGKREGDSWIVFCGAVVQNSSTCILISWSFRVQTAYHSSSTFGRNSTALQPLFHRENVLAKEKPKSPLYGPLDWQQAHLILSGFNSLGLDSHRQVRRPQTLTGRHAILATERIAPSGISAPTALCTCFCALDTL
jgi:hypothetical protein